VSVLDYQREDVSRGRYPRGRPSPCAQDERAVLLRSGGSREVAAVVLECNLGGVAGLLVALPR
jgi:hypothetical protein